MPPRTPGRRHRVTPSGGAFDTLLTVQVASVSQDDIGGMSRTFSPGTPATVWASVQDLGGREGIEAGVLEGRRSTRVVLREDVDGLGAGDRFVAGDRTLEIVTVLHSADRRHGVGPTLMCGEAESQ